MWLNLAKHRVELNHEWARMNIKNFVFLKNRTHLNTRTVLSPSPRLGGARELFSFGACVRCALKNPRRSRHFGVLAADCGLLLMAARAVFTSSEETAPFWLPHDPRM